MIIGHDLFEVRKGTAFLVPALKQWLPDVESALFFAELYRMDRERLSELLLVLFESDLTRALLGEGGLHSVELQDYLVELGFEEQIGKGDIILGVKPPQGVILPEMWESLEIAVAESIREVGEKVLPVMGGMVGNQGELVVESLMQMNRRRPTIGVSKTVLKHGHHDPNAVVLDTSGSMSEETVRAIIEDVVALAHRANAWLIIVSNNTKYWQPGEATVEAVLDAAEYAGTHYETLLELFNRNWGTVVTIADRDSSMSAFKALGTAQGRISMLLDISLVNQPTFLSECLAQIADEKKQLLVANHPYALLG